ncbi:MAG: PhoH family protein, partial [Actinomycetes bacterium]
MADSTAPQARTTIVVPPSQPMVALLGPRDELLRVVEGAFPGTDILVRGNEITVSGERGDIALVERLLDELILVLRTGQSLTPESVERSISMMRSEG